MAAVHVANLSFGVVGDTRPSSSTTGHYPASVDNIINGIFTGLQTQNVSFVVLEAAGRAGGVILSEEIDGYTIDAGPDSLLVQKSGGIELCEELGLGADLVPTKPPRLAYIQRGGRLHPLPAASVLGIPTRLGPFLTTGLFSLIGKLRMASELFVPPRRLCALIHSWQMYHWA